MKTTILAAAFLIGARFVSGAELPRYQLVALEGVPEQNCRMQFVSNQDEALVSCHRENGSSHAVYLWNFRKPQLRDLTAELGQPRAHGSDTFRMNDAGQIAWTQVNPGTPFEARFWSKGTGLLRLDRPGLSSTTVTALFETGEVIGVGMVHDPDSGQDILNSFSWHPATGSFSFFQPLNARWIYVPLSASRDGKLVVGLAYSSEDIQIELFKVDRGSGGWAPELIDLPDANRANLTFTPLVSAAGQIAGWSAITHPAGQKPGAWLGTLEGAWPVGPDRIGSFDSQNDHGDLAGSYSLLADGENAPWHTWLVLDGQEVDVETLVANKPENTTVLLDRINNRRILGGTVRSLDPGVPEQRAVVAIPQP
jgi:hypothetical protein